LIVCASPSVDVRNGDADRMLRHLAHEIVHCCVAEVSGSTKELGDGNVGRRVPAWLDEGLAELVAIEVADRFDILRSAEQQVASFRPGWTEDDVSRALDELDSSQRSRAFAWAVLRVKERVATIGLAAFFASLSGSESVPGTFAVTARTGRS
jgi:hypothetical protein